MNEENIEKSEFSHDAEEELSKAVSQEQLDRLLKDQKKNREQTSINENPFISLRKKEIEQERQYNLQKELINENDRYQRDLVENQFKWANYSNDIATQIDRSKDLARLHSMGVNNIPYSQREYDALLRSGVSLDNDTATLNELKRDEQWSNNLIKNQINANQAYDKITLGTQHALNNLNIKQRYIQDELNRSREQLKFLYETELGAEQKLQEVLGDIDKRLGLTWDIKKDYTTNPLSRLGSGIVESFDEILGSGRILGANDWKAHPIQSLLETIGIMDENKEYINPYKSKIYDDYFKDQFSLNSLQHSLIAESGYTIGMLIQSGLMALATGGAGAIARVGASASIKQSQGLLSKAKALSGELSKEYKTALARGEKGQAKILGLFNVATDSTIAKISQHLLTTQMKLYPFRAASRIADIAKDRMELEGKEYTGLSDLNSHDVAMGATSALMDSVEVPTALLGGALVRKTSNALLKSEKTGSKVAGGLLSLAAIPPTAFITEGITEAVSTIAELAGTYGVDFSEVMSALWSDDPKDAEWKYAIQEAMTIGTVMGGGFTSVGSLVQGVEDIKQGNAERKQQAILKGIMDEQIAKGVGEFARADQYTNRIKAFNDKIDSSNLSKEDAKALKDSYSSIQKLSQENKSILDKTISNKENGIYKQLKQARIDKNHEAIQNLRERLKTSQKAYKAIDTMNNQIDKIFDKAIKSNNAKAMKQAMSELTEQLNSNNIQLGDSNLKLNKSFFGGEATQLFSTMRDIFEKNGVVTKQEFNSMIKQSMKETKDYSNNFFNKKQPIKEESNDEVEVSNQKNVEQESEAKENFKATMNRNKLQDAINKNKDKEVKSREEEIRENNQTKNTKQKEKEDKDSEELISSINSKFIDASADESIEDENFKKKLLDSAVYSNNKTLSDQLKEILKKYKIQRTITKTEFVKIFKDKMNIELTEEETDLIINTIKDNNLINYTLSYERDIVIKDTNGGIKQIIKENISIKEIEEYNNQLLSSIEDGIEELHKKIIAKEDTIELKNDIKSKIDDMNSNLFTAIQLANTNQLTEEQRGLAKSMLINMVDKANALIAQYGKYANMLEEQTIPELLEGLSDDSLIAKIKTIIKRFSIVLKRLIDNFNQFVQNSKDIKNDLATLKTDIREVIDPMNKLLSNLAIIKDFKTTEDFIQWNNTTVKEELGLSYTNKTSHNIREYNDLLNQNFDFEKNNTIETMSILFLTKYFNEKSNKSKHMYNLSLIFGDEAKDLIKEIQFRKGKYNNKPSYDDIVSGISRYINYDDITYTLKASVMSLLKIIAVDRNPAKIFNTEDYKIIDNVQIESSFKEEFKSITGIDLSNNPKMVSFLFTLADTFMKNNQRIKGTYVSFTSSESSYNTANTLAKIIDGIDLSKMKNKNKNGEEYTDRKRLTNTVIGLLKNPNQKKYLTEQVEYARKNGDNNIDYAIENYSIKGDLFELSQRLQSVLYKDSIQNTAHTKVFLGLRREDSNLSPIVDILKLYREDNKSNTYDILHKAQYDKRAVVDKANRKRYILNQSKLQVFKEQFGENTLEEIHNLTENGYKLLLEDYIDNPPTEFNRDNPLFYVPVTQYDEAGSNIGVKYYKLTDNPKLIEALSLDGVLKDFRQKNSHINSKELTDNYASKIRDTMKDIGTLYALFQNGNKPFHMKYNLQDTNRLYMIDTAFNILENKLLREFISIDKMDIKADNAIDYKGEEKISEDHRTLIRNIILLATLEGAYDKTPFKVNDEGLLQWIIKDNNGNDITEKALKDIDTITDMIIKGNQEANSKLDDLIAKQGDSFDFTDDGNTNLTNLLVLKNALKKGTIVPNDITVELDGLSTGISENLQYMNASESTAMLTSTQKFFIVDNNIYSGYLNQASLAKAKMKQNPTFENIVQALSYDIYGSVISELYQSLKGLPFNTGNVYLDTLTYIFSQSLDNPNKIYKQLRDLGKKLVLGPNYGQKFTSMIKSNNKDTIKDFILQESLKQVNEFVSTKIKELGIENQNIKSAISTILQSKDQNDKNAYIRSILSDYLSSLTDDKGNADFSENTIGQFLLSRFRNQRQNDVIHFLGNNFNINLMSDKDKSEITQKRLSEIESMHTKVIPLLDKLESELRQKDKNVSFDTRNDIVRNFVNNNTETANELKKLYKKNSPVFIATVEYYLSDVYKDSEGNNGFIVRSLNNFKEIGQFKDRSNEIKRNILKQTISEIKHLTFKDLVQKNKDKLIDIIIAFNKNSKKTSEEIVSEFKVDLLSGNINKYISYLSYIDDTSDEIAKLCELTYKRINEFIGKRYDDASNIHITFKKEKPNDKDKRSSSSAISSILKEENKTEVNINDRINPKTKQHSIYSTSMENINILENYMSSVVNLIEHDIEASIMNDLVLDDNIGASFSIYDGIFVRVDKITETANKWNTMLGESRLVNKDYSTIATLLRLDNLSTEFLNSLKDPNSIVKNSLDNVKFKEELRYKDGEELESSFASSLSSDLFHLEVDNQLLNHTLLNNTIIIEKDIEEGQLGGYTFVNTYNGYTYIVVKKGTINQFKQKDETAIETIMHELYHTSSLRVFKEAIENKDVIANDLQNELDRRYRNFIFMLQQSSDKDYNEFAKYLNSLEDSYSDISNNTWAVEIIPQVFANPRTLFKKLKGIENKKEYIDLLAMSQQAVQYANFYNNKNKDDELFEMSGTIFDFTSKNTPINMRVIDLKIKNAHDIKNPNGYDYSVNQMTYKELKESKLINYLAKSSYMSIDKNILPLAVSKTFITENLDVVLQINNEDIVFGRNFIIQDGVEDSFLDDVFDQLINDDNYSLLDAYLEIKDATEDPSIYFLPKTILSQESIDIIREKGGKALFDDFLTLINSAMYNQSALLDESFQTEFFKDKNTEELTTIDDIDYEFEVKVNNKLFNNIDKALATQTKQQPITREAKQEQPKQQPKLTTNNTIPNSKNKGLAFLYKAINEGLVNEKDAMNILRNNKNSVDEVINIVKEEDSSKKKDDSIDDNQDVSYQLRPNQQSIKSTQRVTDYLDLNNEANNEVSKQEAIDVIDEYIASLTPHQIEMMSPIMSEIKKSLDNTTIIMSDLFNDASGMSFIHNGRKYIVLSSNNVQQNTLIHELGHTVIDSVMKNDSSIRSKNLVSDIRYLQSYIMEEMRKNPDLMTKLGIMKDGKTNAIFDEVFSKPNEFIAYFLFDKEKLDILSNFTIQDLNSRNYQSPKSIIGKIFKIISLFMKKVTELLSLNNSNRNTKLDKYLSDNFMKIAELNDPNVMKAYDNTLYNQIQTKVNNIIVSLFDKTPILKSFQNVDQWLKKNNYTKEQMEAIIDEIKKEYDEKGFLSSIINYDYKGVFKPLALMRILNILNPMYYKSPLHRKVALQMLNRLLNSTNNFIANELGRILRDFGVISIDNQNEIEALLGQKLALDQLKAKTNQFISETYQDARKRILGGNMNLLEKDDRKWVKPIEYDPLNMSQFSPKEMFERSIGSIIGEIQIGKGFNENESFFNSKVGFKSVVDNLFDNSESSLKDTDSMILILQNEMADIMSKITDQPAKDKEVRTFMRKLEILGYTRLTNQVSDSSIENQAEIVRQASKEFKDAIKDPLSVRKEGLINKMEQITTLYAIRHIKTLANKDRDIAKYKEQIDFLRKYITFEKGKMNKDAFDGLSITSSLHTSLVKESQTYESAKLSKEDIAIIQELREENSLLINAGNLTKDIREKINQNNKTIEDIIENSITVKEDFEQDNYLKDYSRDGYTKYSYNPEVDIVSIQYVNPDLYEKEQRKQYYNELAENNNIDTYEDLIEYKLGLGYEVLDHNGNAILDKAIIDAMVKSKSTITMRYEGKFGYSPKYTPYSFIGVKNKTSGSLLDDNMSLSDDKKKEISSQASERFKAEQHIIANIGDDYDFEVIRKGIKNNFVEYRYSTNADTQLRTKQSKFMIEKMSKLDNSIEKQLLGLENSIFQKKNADRFNAKLAISIIEDNKLIHNDKNELENAQKNYIKLIDLKDKDYTNPKVMLGGNVYSILLRTLFRYNQDKPLSEQINELYISQDNAEYLLGIKKDKLSVSVTENVKSPFIRKWLNRIESIFDIFWNDVKETVLIRNPNVLYQNIMSNFSTLTSFGLSISQIAERSQAIEKELELWEKDLKDYSEAQNRLSILMNSRRATKDQIEKYTIEINNLEQRLLNSRVFYPMMNGVDSNIVDETVVNVNEIDNVLRNGLTTLLSKAGIKNQISDAVINNLILSQTSDIYKKAMKFNRFGDIIPRVIAFELFKTKENLDNQAAMNKAQDLFVNYNMPLTSKFLMLLDKIGMQQFIRFNVRVQKTAAMNFMQYPVSTLSSILGANFLQQTLPFGQYLIVDPLSNENAITKNYNMFGMLSRNLTPFYRWNGFTDLLNGR